MSRTNESAALGEGMVATPRKKVLVTGLVIVALGALSCGTWLGEVVLLKGWEGLHWLEGYPKASFVGVACVVLSVVLAIRAALGSSIRRVALFVAVSFPIALLSFELARSFLYNLHSRSAAFMALAGETAMARHFVLTNAAGLVGAAVLTAVGFTVAARLLLARVKWWMAGLFLLAIALVMPMGLLTVLLLPALNGNTDYLHVVKIGYPLFWTNVLMGLAAWLGVRGCGSTAPRGRTPENGATNSPAT